MISRLLSKCCLIGCGLLMQFSPLHADPVSSFLPNQSYNPEIPTPEDYLGYGLGDWHVRHDQVLGYFKLLAEKSDRISLEHYGNSWELKPQIVLIVTSKKNQQQLTQIKKQRQQANKITQQSPLVVWLGYSIHGNEASGTNAALAVAYYLAAAEDKQTDKLLNDTVVLVDPSFNPDGYSRFSSWVNANKALVANGDPLDRELNEPWPGARTNHYWFDLNRDWLLAVNPESQNRLKLFHQWHPNIVTDHHEMGSDSSYFFQPGVLQRQNPLTPVENYALTSRLAEFHAKALDNQGRNYFTKEFFDDFYIGKGSTYPDINGGVGILFEQASIRGHYRKTIFGPRKFSFAIKNHVTTSLSTLKGAAALNQPLKIFQINFFKQQNKSKKVFIFSNKERPQRSLKLVNFLQQHDIKVYQLTQPLTKGKVTIETGFVVPLNQPHGKLIEGIFDQRTKFEDSAFYDVSAWALQFAYDLPLLKFNSLSKKYRGKLIDEKYKIDFHNLTSQPNVKNAVAYVFEWRQENSPLMLSRLLSENFRVSVNKKPFSIINSNNSGKEKRFSSGNIIVSFNQQKYKQKQQDLLFKLSQGYSINLFPMSTGLNNSGLDLGSPNMKLLKKPTIALLTGEGVSGYQAGEVRYLVEQKLALPISVIQASQLTQKNLKQYSHLVMVNGDYDEIEFQADKKLKSTINNWVKSGGSLIAFEGAAKWASQLEGVEFKMELTTKDQATPARRNFSSKDKLAAVDVIGGAIFANDVDPSHPLAYGSVDRELASFKTSRLIFTNIKSAYEIVSRYTSNPLLSGYASNLNLEKIANTPMLVREKYGDGQMILFADDPNFRGYWYATMRMFTNSLYFSGIY